MKRFAPRIDPHNTPFKDLTHGTVPWVIYSYLRLKLWSGYTELTPSVKSVRWWR